MNLIIRSILLTLFSAFLNTWTAQQSSLIGLPNEVKNSIFDYIFSEQNPSVVRDNAALKLTCTSIHDITKAHPVLNPQSIRYIMGDKLLLGGDYRFDLLFNGVTEEMTQECPSSFKKIITSFLPEQWILDGIKKFTCLKEKSLQKHSAHAQKIALMEDLLNCTSNPTAYGDVMDNLIQHKKTMIIKTLINAGFPNCIQIKGKACVDLLTKAYNIKRRTDLHSDVYKNLEQIEKILETGNTLSNSFISFGENNPADAFSLYGPYNVRNLALVSSGKSIPAICSIL